ncbi:fimbrial protein [Orbus sasakiae]|uniref:Fimbrial protein n=1 Tax=Orbus sasakiae TaxID=1078475 RepID=A0ABP9MZ59_9GAMM
MKKLYLTAIMFATATASFSSLAASNNTISFQGEVTDQTCELTVNGELESPIILLPTVSTADFASNVAGKTPFEVGVAGCKADGSSISTVFVGNNVSTAGNLGNTGTAANVDIQILKPDNSTVINFTDKYVGASDLTLADSATSATSTYYAQYYTSGTTADTINKGTVTASLQYSVSYQ